MVFLERFTKVKDPGKATRIFVPDLPAAPSTAFSSAAISLSSSINSACSARKPSPD